MHNHHGIDFTFNQRELFKPFHQSCYLPAEHNGKRDHNDQWRSLGAAILHRLVIEELLGCRDLPKPTYVNLVEQVAEGVATGNYPLAAMVMPPTIAQVRDVSLTGERLPAKSTYFYPKLLSGLVFNPVE